MDKNKVFYHRNLLERKLRLIKNMRMINITEATRITVTKCFKTEVIEPQPKEDEFTAVELPYQYGSIDDYMWTKAKFANLDPSKTYYGHFDFGTGSGGLTCGAETLLYLNGIEHSGVDLNHKEIYLGTLNCETELIFRTWSGVADESRLEELEYIQGEKPLTKLHTLKTLQLFELDQKVNNLYYNLFAMLEAYKALIDTNIIASNQIINDLSKIFLKYDNCDLTREKLYELDNQLEAVINGYEDKSLVQMIALGQTHIDLAWLWRVKHTREKTARSFSTLLNLMKQNPQFTFLQSQPQIFAYLKEDYPDLYKRFQAEVKNGNIEVDGAMWLESDCNIPSGESLVRQVLYGKNFIKEEFDSESKILWMPDVFGYSWAIPQILKKSNVDIFCTTKMQWNQYNKMPFNTFKWRGIDGTEISTHLIENFKFFTINAESLVNGWNEYRDKDLTNEVLYQHGFGDGGGGPRQDDIELVKRFDKIPGLPNIKYEKASQYFSRLDHNLNNSDGYVHTWDGELYLELHRGTFTSQARMKLLNRRLEYKIRSLEMLTVICKLDGIKLDNIQKRIEKCWQSIMLNQFHDIIPGSSINQVYDDAEIEYELCYKRINEIEDLIASNYPKLENQFLLFNSYHLPISQVVQYKTDKELMFKLNGEILNCVKNHDGYKIYVPDLQPLDFTTIDIADSNDSNLILTEELLDSQITIDNDFYQLTINEIGQITRLFDKELEQELVTDNKIFNKLVSYEDRPLNWDAWDIDIFYDKRERVVDELISRPKISKSKLETVIEIELKHFNSTIKQFITISNVSKVIDIHHKVNYQDDHRLLRTLFETNVRSTEARFDIQSGNVARPTHRNTSWDMQKFEVLAHKWADISTNSFGVAILNDCKYGYSSYNSTIGLSLIKAGQFPDKSQDIGNHEYTYSIYPHSGDVLTSDIDKYAHVLNENIEPIFSKYPLSMLPIINNDNIFVDAIKLSEKNDDIVMRIHEWRNKGSKVNINCQYSDINLLEQEENETKNSISSYEIKTMKLERK